MKFKIIEKLSEVVENEALYLQYIHYDDYGYCTSYMAYALDSLGERVRLGEVKIGCFSLKNKVEEGESRNGYPSYSINALLPKTYFLELEKHFFSLGQDTQYYKNINKYFGQKKECIYSGLRDLAFDFTRFDELYNQREQCLISSLMRTIHYPNVEQFHRITVGDAELTRYNFGFQYRDSKISFDIVPDSLPPSNIHVLIGRNGVGKTWLLFNMVCRILESMDLLIDKESSSKYKLNKDFKLEQSSTKFAGVIGLSFSVFDDGLSSIKALRPEGYDLQMFQDDLDKKYKYIGLITKKDYYQESTDKIKLPVETPAISNTMVKSVEQLVVEFECLIKKIYKDEYKTSLYMEMCKNLETDTMFRDNGFIKILETYFKSEEDDTSDIIEFFKLLSSGHMIIILSLTALCESIFEKTIVFIDEPETHLHPPLLSTYIRTLSFLLRKKNAVGIIATHSPIVLQEVPKVCTTKVERSQSDMCFYRPQNETFASGTDELTREVFGYEIMKTGFYKLLEENLQDDFEGTYEKFNAQIGFLGQIMLQGLLNKKEDGENEED